MHHIAYRVIVFLSNEREITFSYQLLNFVSVFFLPAISSNFLGFLQKIVKFESLFQLIKGIIYTFLKRYINLKLTLISLEIEAILILC